MKHSVGCHILSGAVFVHSLSSANAFPQGSNISLGSNPIASWSGQIGNDGWYTLDTFQDDFIITDLSISGTDYYDQLHTQQSNAYITSGVLQVEIFINIVARVRAHILIFASGMKIQPGTTVYMYVLEAIVITIFQDTTHTSHNKLQVLLTPVQVLTSTQRPYNSKLMG